MNKLYYLVIILFVFSCRKKDELPSSQCISTSNCNDILYKDLNVDSTFIMPVNSSIHFLDINNDSIVDLRFSLYHNYTVYTPSFSFHSYVIRIDGIDSTIKIISPQNEASLDTSYVISTNSPTTNYGADLLRIQMYSFPYEPFLTKGFVGFKLFRNGNHFYGWIRLKATTSGLIIDDFALNKCTNSSIKVGFH